MNREAMTVVFWARPDKRREAEGVETESAKRPPTRVHVSRGGSSSACGSSVPPDATIVAVTPDWHELTTCYNCAYRLWVEHAPPGFVRPRNSQDFPPRRECPHHPGEGRDPESCPRCTSGSDESAGRDTALLGTMPPQSNDDPDELRPQVSPNVLPGLVGRSALSAVARELPLSQEPIDIAVEQLNALVSNMGSAPTPEDRLAVGILAAQIEVAIRLGGIERSLDRETAARQLPE